MQASRSRKRAQAAKKSLKASDKRSRKFLQAKVLELMTGEKRYAGFCEQMTRRKVLVIATGTMMCQ